MLKKYRNIIIISLSIIVILLLLFWASQAAGKTVWEYLEILIIPAVLGIVALLSMLGLVLFIKKQIV